MQRGRPPFFSTSKRLFDHKDQLDTARHSLTTVYLIDERGFEEGVSPSKNRAYCHTRWLRLSWCPRVATGRFADPGLKRGGGGGGEGVGKRDNQQRGRSGRPQDMHPSPRPGNRTSPRSIPSSTPVNHSAELLGVGLGVSAVVELDVSWVLTLNLTYPEVARRPGAGLLTLSCTRRRQMELFRLLGRTSIGHCIETLVIFHGSKPDRYSQRLNQSSELVDCYDPPSLSVQVDGSY